MDIKRLAVLSQEAFNKQGEAFDGWFRGLSNEEQEHVRQLLEAEGAAPEWLRGTDESLEGQRFGAFRMVRELGRGGMGVVYLAERCDGHFEQMVAVKLLPTMLASSERRTRFVAERKLLGKFDHPAIARLLDAGEDPNHGLWLAMEYVEGTALDAYCEAEQPSAEVRIDLIIAAAEAMQHAHAHLIVHRDLKPANLMVKSDGQLKVLDFGIASMLQSNDQSHLPARMTAAYAAPEQLTGDAVSVATDVYSLAAVLFELLADALPWPHDEQSSGTRTAAHTMLLPSLADLPAERRQPSALSRMANTRVRSQDLDAILNKALALEPSQRYSSMGAFADDLKKYRQHLPVQARGNDAGYRFGRFVRRNRFAVGALSLLLLGLSLATVVAWQQARQAREAERQAVLARNFVTDLFAPDALGGDVDVEIPARQLLERGLSRTQIAFAGEPRLGLAFVRQIGGLFIKLGDGARAEEILAQSLSDAEQQFGKQDDLVESIRLDYAESLLAQGKFDEAQTMLQQMAEPDEEELRAERLALLGQSHSGKQQYDQAEQNIEAALAMDRSGTAPQAVARDLYFLGGIALSKQDWPKAQTHLQEALSIFDSNFGEDGGSDPRMADVLRDLGATAQALGDMAAAERHLSRSLTRYEDLLGEAHPAVAYSARALADVQRGAGRLDQALSNYQKALTIDQNNFGDADERSLEDLRGIALTRVAMGHVTQGRADLARAAELAQQKYGQDSAQAGLVALAQGALALAGQDLETAQAKYSAARQALKADPTQRINAALALRGLGYTLLLANQTEEAIKQLNTVSGELGKMLPPTHPHSLLTRANTAQAYALNQQERQASALQVLLKKQSQGLPETHPLQQLRSITDARVALARRDFDVALKAIDQADHALDYAPWAKQELRLLRTEWSAKHGANEQTQTACKAFKNQTENVFPPMLSDLIQRTQKACAEAQQDDE